MSSSPPLQARRSAGEVKKTSPSSIVTRNGARKAKIQTRAMSAAKPSASVIAAKRKAQQKKKQPMDTILRDPYQIAMESKSKVKGPTGFVTDPRMAEHRCLWDDNYPECPERLIGVLERCRELNLIEQCKVYPPRAATKEEILALHAPSVYNLMEETHGSNDLKYLEEVSSGFDAVYIHPSTHEMALSAAGSTLDMVDRLVSDELQNAAVLVRPPGHHAMRAEPCGYCVYNNVALGAQRALQLGVKRILIVDWDVHHGQATQQMFYDDPRVVYFSVHRYEHGSFWPNLRQSDFPYTGCGQGEGYTFNVPLNHTGMTDADYIAIWHQVLLPMAFEYQPELVMVSAGYDAALGCPEGEMEVSPACYASLVHMLQGVCPRLLLALEGGYCLRSLADAAALTLRTMLGHAPPALPPAEPCDQIRDSILNCIYSHKKHWRCFNYQPTYSIDTTVLNVCDGEKEKHVVTFKWEGDETRSDKFATRNCYPLQDDAFKKRINEKLDHLKMVTDLSLPKHPVLYIYDQTMLKHHNVCEPGHVECPERIMRIHERHRDFGLLDRLHQLPARSATDEEILSVHTKEYLDSLKELSSTKLRDLNSQKNSFDSVYFHPDSLQSAAAAVGGVLQMVDAVLSSGGAGVCVVRPPGHHAAAAAPRGFCLLNSVCVAARRAAAGGARVLLLDWDVHHGDGTQAATYHDNQILYMSIHRYDNGSFFPHSTAANYTSVGEGKGEGYNINIPWNKRGMGDAEYLSALAAVVLPVAYEYSPDLVLVSAGFDACVGDPLGGCKVTPECFGRMTHMLRGLAGGRIILCLEGGYNVTSISYAMTMCTKALLGDPIQYHYDPKQTVHWSAVESINNVIKTHKKYWKSLKFQLALPIEDVIGPLPKSRGLPDSEEAQIDYTKAVSDKLKKDSIYDSNLAEDISALSIKNSCPDGIHCGTDDESEAADKANVPNSSQGGSNESASSSQMNESTSTVLGDKPTSLVDYLSENMHAIVNEEMFAVIPLTWCPHLESLYAIPGSVRLEQGVKCVNCDHTEENWVCLHCYITACGRHVNGHMQEHFQSTQHPLALSLTDLSVWCSVCDAYVDNALLYDAKNNAHRCKFGEDMPWCYSNSIQMH